MAEKKKEEIRVEDRRFFDKEGNPVTDKEAGETSNHSTEQEPVTKAAQANEAPPSQSHGLDFISILFTYVHTCLIYLGEVKDPEGQATGDNLEGARQMIDILEMMQQKTKGNLTTQEDKYLDSALYDLRMRYMKKAKLLK
jgi:hypothetical protein